MDSEFIRWFEAQYGPEPLTQRERHDLLLQVNSARIAEERLRDCGLYFGQRTAALYAWRAARKAGEAKAYPEGREA